MSNPDVPQPIVAGRGGPDTGPRDVLRDQQAPDNTHAPSTDRGTLPNMRFSFSDVHVRLQPGGWSREVTVRELPVATTLAGVNMKLDARNERGETGVRELHWHKQSEWSYMLSGHASVTAVDADGRNFMADVGPGDLWFFPAGIPHSIQALEDGCEFVLVFDDGNFTENSTFSVSDWFAHTPRAVLAKNFGVPESAFASIPDEELYLFWVPEPPGHDEDVIASPQGGLGEAFVYRLLAQPPIKTAHGTVRIADSSNFTASTTTACAFVEIEPGGMRELHWHPNTDEWQYYVSGEARMTVFAAEGKARTFDMRAGDVGYVPFAMGHYIENTGSETLRFLEMFASDRFRDVSLAQWLALTPPELVQAHLKLPDDLIARLPKLKPVVVHR
ncbi:cupin domain-containing protein [Deinococcus pimensis]|uniref:cupin domain-containing protein n=1 Tax=Deinococcus pimensis TaxID=309888 RepID=UPI0004B5425E|nr:cupin domain-containing protein [Deinococcus pimensis]